MTQEITKERPAGVTAVAIAFLLAGAYLFAVGATMLARPGLISMAAGSELLADRPAGPYISWRRSRADRAGRGLRLGSLDDWRQCRVFLLLPPSPTILDFDS